MRITRRHWLQSICTLPLLSSLSNRAFVFQQANPKTLYRMNRFHIAGFQFYDEDLYYEDPYNYRRKDLSCFWLVAGTFLLGSWLG